MTELQSHNNGFSNIDWLNRRNMNSSNTPATYPQQVQQPPQAQQQQGTLNTSYYAHQLPPINSISSSSTSIAQLNHEPIHLNEDERKQQQQQQQPQTLLSWDNLPSATTTTDSTVSGTSSYDLYHQNNTVSTPSPSMSADKSSSMSNNKKQRIPSTKDIHVEKNTDGKPPYSYATLIKYAIENSPNNKLTLSEIYQWVLEHYPYYGTAGSGWKNSIRHNLSLNKSFVRVARPINEPGKGSYWIVDYRSAETEHRSRHLLPTSGGGRRNNRSGSDPSSNTPYRPEWPGSLSSTSSTSSFARRDMRDARSLSMDAAALSKNMNGVGLNGSYSIGNYKSMTSEGTGYYGNAYAYGRQFATNHHNQQQQRNTSLRHNNSTTTGYMPSPGFNVYMENIPADQTQYQQLPSDHHHHQHPHSSTNNTVQQHSSSGVAAKPEHPHYVYDQSAGASAGTGNGTQQPMYYHSYGSGQPSPAPTSIIEKAAHHPTTTTTKSTHTATAEHAVYSTFSSTPTPSAQLPSPLATTLPVSTTTTTKDETTCTPSDRRLSSSTAAAANTVNPSSCFYSSNDNNDNNNQTPVALAQSSSSPSVKSGKQESTTDPGDFNWGSVL